jgi:hypothetical protein
MIAGRALSNGAGNIKCTGTVTEKSMTVSNLIIGYTTREHLLLDLDETDIYKVARLAKQLIREYSEIGDILILGSSTPSKLNYTKFDKKGIPQWRFTYQNFHLVADNIISYDRSLEIIDCLVELDVLQPEYREIRLFRGDMTLRTSCKPLVNRTVPPPEPLYLINNHVCPYKNHKILDFFTFLRNTEQALSNLAVVF